jgi:TolB-like protein/class 3 adenylate cyclase/Tfp pilus assembly protein PilF
VPQSHPTRSLAAIVFTDIVGYSALSHRDDTIALRLLNEHFRLVREVLRAFGGQEIKTIGDSVLMEFASAQAATACAIVIQQQHQQRNAKVAAAQQFQIRIGIHLGDVEHHDRDVFGDGVNIAARLQPLAPVGGIAISDHVRGQLREELRKQFVSRGAQDLKNIETPVGLFVLEADAIAGITAEAPSPARKQSRQRPSLRRYVLAVLAIGILVPLAGLTIALMPFLRPDGHSRAVVGKSIAVLPFADLSPSHDQEYFADGMAEELLNALAKIKDLKVAGRTSSFSYKGRNEDLRTIGKALAVAHVLEGSVRKQGDKVRITAQLIQAEDGYHLWSETYDGDLSDVFELQERIARAITEQLKVVLQGEQQQRLVPIATSNPEAYALYLEASGIFNRRDGRRWPDAIAQLEKAIELDPQFARAHARLATVAAIAPLYTKLASDLALVEEHAKRASELEPGLAEPHAALAQSLARRRQFVAAYSEFEQALALEPDDITASFWFGIELVQAGYSRRGYELLDHVLALDPKLPNALFWRGMGYLYGGDAAGGERLLQRAAEAKLAFVGVGLSGVEAVHGRREEAAAQLAAGYRAIQFEVTDESVLILARGVYGDAAARAAALSWVDRYLASKPEPFSGVVVQALLRMEQPELALSLAADRPTSNDAGFFGILWGSIGRSARRLPEFPEFARKAGFAALWDRYGAPDLCRRRAPGDYVCE